MLPSAERFKTHQVISNLLEVRVEVPARIGPRTICRIVDVVLQSHVGRSELVKRMPNLLHLGWNSSI